MSIATITGYYGTVRIKIRRKDAAMRIMIMVQRRPREMQDDHERKENVQMEMVTAMGQRRPERAKARLERLVAL